MTADQIARALGAKFGTRKTARAKCPVHRSRGLTLSIVRGPDRVSITCHAGCHSDDVLATVGLSWRDCLYEDKRLSPAESREWAKRKELDALYHREKRVMELQGILTAINRPKRPVTLTDCAHATMEHRMECYFARVSSCNRPT